MCHQPGCGGPASGVCIENFRFEECPHLVVSTENFEGESYAVPEDELESAQGDYVPTSLGATLDSSGCDAFLRRRKATVVAVIAGPEVGKTTLLATLYELARRGKMSGVEFAGSETILGFEQRCYLARAGSSLDVPDTPRTRVSGPHYLHLRLLIEDEYNDLLLADRPGENYTRAIEAPAVLRGYEEVVRAEHLLLLVDGREFASNPHAVSAGTRRLYRGLLENGLRREQQIHLVVTKIDLFDGDELDELRAKAHDLWTELKARSGQHVVHLQMTGARARAGSDSFGEGLDVLARGLIQSRQKREFQLLLPGGEIGATSMLNRLMRRMVAQP